MATNNVPGTVVHGAKVYPNGFEETFCTDRGQIVNLLDRLQKAGLDFVKIENLYTFDGQNCYVASQGE